MSNPEWTDPLDWEDAETRRECEPEAANEITRLNAENDELRAALLDTQERSRARGALVDEMREGLEPFARVKDAAKRPDSERVRVSRPMSLDEIRERDEQGRISSDGMTEILSFDGLTLGDFRKARALITKASRDSGHG